MAKVWKPFRDRVDTARVAAGRLASNSLKKIVSGLERNCLDGTYVKCGDDSTRRDKDFKHCVSRRDLLDFELPVGIGNRCRQRSTVKQQRNERGFRRDPIRRQLSMQRGPFI